MTTDERVQKAWSIIHAWFAANAPQVLDKFGPPASDAELSDVEVKLGQSLPADVHAFYRLHNGIATEIFPSCVGFDDMGFTLLSLAQIVDEWTIWKENNDAGEFAEATLEAAKGIGAQWWNDGWIPFATNGGGDCQCVDLAPAPVGSVGQVISVWHDMDERRLLAPSFVEFLEKIAAGLAAGRFKFKSGYGPVAVEE